MFLIDAEDYGLGKAVCLSQKLRQMLRHALGTYRQYNNPLKILGLIFIILYLTVVSVELALAGPPPCRVISRYNAMNAVRGKEAVFYALFQAVLIERIRRLSCNTA